MRSIVLITLSLFLGTFFIFVGLLKITQLIQRDMHREIRRNFIQYVKVFPLTEHIIGFKITPKIYRLFMGYLEIVCGLLLVLLPNNWKLKNISTIALLISNLLSLYTHLKLNDKFERIAPSIVFSLMLICRLIIYVQVKRQFDNKSKQKECEEIQRLIDRDQFYSDKLSINNSDDENESIGNLDDEELEKLIRMSKLIHKQRKRKEIEREDEHQTLDTMGTQTLDESIDLTNGETESSRKLGMIIDNNSLDLHVKQNLIINELDEIKKSI